MSTSSKIILKKSSVSEKIPQTGDLDFGELAINFADGKLYFRDSNDQIQFFEKSDGTISSDSDFTVLSNNSDLGILTDSVTNTLDFELVTDAITRTFDNQFLALSGIITPDLFILPSVSITELTDGQEGQLVYVPDAGDGPTLAFFDGLDWNFGSGGDDLFAFKTTDDLNEGSTNLYFTEARARDSISVSGDLTYNSTTGVLGVDVSFDNISEDILPDSDETHNLGSPTKRWKDLFLSGSTIDLGGSTISVDQNGNFEFKDSTGEPSTVSLDANDTDDLSEGSTNLYFTDARARDSVSASGDLSYNSTTGVFSVTTYKSSDFDTDFAGKSTTDLSEGNNLYFTEARARNSISVTGDLTYNPATGVLGVDVPEGYDSSDFDTDFTGKSTTDLSEGSNLYFTTARIDSHLSGGTGVTYNAGEISIGQDVSTTSNVTFNDLVVTGDLVVQGDQTTIETAVLQVEDQNIELGKVDSPTNSTANTGGITVLGGNDGNKTWKWLSSTSSWTSSEHIDVVSGKEYKINGTTVLSNDTLGSGVVTSSLTTVGALDSGSITSGFGNIDIGSSTFTGNGSGLTNVVADSLTTARTIGGVSFDGTANINLPGVNITGNQDTTGNAATAASLQNARQINGTSFDGTANITVPGNFANRTTNESGHAVFIGTSATGNQSMFTNTNYRFNPSTGELFATDFNSTSDETLKENVTDIENALDMVSQMRGVRYTWKDNGIAGVGVIAQEMEQVLPEVVSNSGDHKTVSYGNVVGVLIEAIKELKAEIEELKRYK